MKKHICYILVVFFILTQISCNYNTISSETKYYIENTLEFDLEKDVKGSKSLLSLIDNIKFMELKSNKDFLLGSISKVVLSNEFVYVMDKISKSLFKYNKNGEPLLKISSIGNGPGEYIELSDFTVKNDTIIILDSSSSSLLFYDKLGKFIKKINPKSTSKKMAIFNNLIYLYNANQVPFFSNDNVKIIDFEGNNISDCFKIPSYLKNKGFSIRKPFDIDKDDVTFINNFDSNIYSVGVDSIYIKYKLDFKKNNLKKSFLEKNKDTNIGLLLQNISKKGKVFAIDYLNKTSDFISFIFLYKGKSHYAYYDLKNKKKGVYKSNKIDKSSYINMLQHMVFNTFESNEDMFISRFNISMLEKWDISTIKSFGENIKTENIEALYKMRDGSEHNPFLIFINFKK